MDIVRAIEVAEKMILLAMRVIKAAGGATQPDGSPTRIPDDKGRDLLRAQGLTESEIAHVMGD